ncbi:hypothetical protein BOX15_Mlig024356g1 [Macrostomum lignano]|uniref:HMG box domain-containing protein n=1 Tax=Macrostomum lignano TaxID=282301 RepID=A0A267DSY4_9PLAT|nr:hypothetical protein BOX15_Mlig024356g1 [Macrostomum lignano]
MSAELPAAIDVTAWRGARVLFYHEPLAAYLPGQLVAFTPGNQRAVVEVEERLASSLGLVVTDYRSVKLKLKSPSLAAGDAGSGLSSRQFRVPIEEVVSDAAPQLSQLVEGQLACAQLPQDQLADGVYRSVTVDGLSAAAQPAVTVRLSSGQLAPVHRSQLRLLRPPWQDELDAAAAAAAAEVAAAAPAAATTESTATTASASDTVDDLSSPPPGLEDEDESDCDPQLASGRFSKGDVVRTPGGVKKKFNGKQWRRLCSADGCSKESQRRGFCSRHLSQKGKASKYQRPLEPWAPGVPPAAAAPAAPVAPAAFFATGYSTFAPASVVTPLSSAFSLQLHHQQQQPHPSCTSLLPILESELKRDPSQSVLHQDQLPAVATAGALDGPAARPAAASESDTAAEAAPTVGSAAMEDEDDVFQLPERPQRDAPQADKSQQQQQPEHIRRPMNAFILFSKRNRARVQEENPGLDNRAVSKILGELWYNLSKVDREQYNSLASQVKSEHFRQNPNFRWSSAKERRRSDSASAAVTQPLHHQIGGAAASNGSDSNLRLLADAAVAHQAAQASPGLPPTLQRQQQQPPRPPPLQPTVSKFRRLSEHLQQQGFQRYSTSSSGGAVLVPTTVQPSLLSISDQHSQHQSQQQQQQQQQQLDSPSAFTHFVLRRNPPPPVQHHHSDGSTVSSSGGGGASSDDLSGKAASSGGSRRRGERPAPLQLSPTIVSGNNSAGVGAPATNDSPSAVPASAPPEEAKSTPDGIFKRQLDVTTKSVLTEVDFGRKFSHLPEFQPGAAPVSAISPRNFFQQHCRSAPPTAAESLYAAVAAAAAAGSQQDRHVFFGQNFSAEEAEELARSTLQMAGDDFVAVTPGGSNSGGGGPGTPRSPGGSARRMLEQRRGLVMTLFQQCDNFFPTNEQLENFQRKHSDVFPSKGTLILKVREVRQKLRQTASQALPSSPATVTASKDHRVADPDKSTP